MTTRLPLSPQDRIAITICALFTLGWFTLLTAKYLSFGYYDWDMALYCHAMWNLVHGSLHSSLWGTNFLTNHAEYITFLLAPLYTIVPHPLTLILLKIFSFSGGMFVFYLIAKDIIGPKLAILFMLLYAFYPPNISMLVYEFYFENLAILFIFLLYYFYKNERLVAFSICALLAALIKENIALVVAMFGIYALISRREQKFWWVLIPLVIGGGVFYLGMFIITPFLRAQAAIPSPNNYLESFYLKPLPQELGIFKRVWANIPYLLTKLFTPINFTYLTNLFGPFWILSLWSPSILLLGAPLFLQHLLSSSVTMKLAYFHYFATIVPFIFIASVYGLAKIRVSCHPRAFGLIIILVLLGSGLYVFADRANPRLTEIISRWDDHLDPIRWNALRKIPPQEPTAATFAFLPELSNRKDLYSFFKIWTNKDPFSSHEKDSLPPQVKYALFDWEDPWLWGYSLANTNLKTKRMIFERLKRIFLDSDWTATYAVENIVLFERKREGIRLVEVSADPGLSPAALKTGQIIDGCFVLGKTIIGDATPEGLLPLTLEWHSLKRMNKLYLLTFKINSENRTIAERNHFIGYGIYPSILWQKGDLIRERYWLMLPANLPKGDFSLQIEIIDFHYKKFAKIYPANGQDLTSPEKHITINVRRPHETKD